MRFCGLGAKDERMISFVAVSKSSKALTCNGSKLVEDKRKVGHVQVYNGEFPSLM